MRVAVVTDLFPYKWINDFVFLENNVRAMTDCGVDVDVISPISITKCIMRHRPLMSYHENRKTNNGNTYNTYWPRYISFGNNRLLKDVTLFFEKRALIHGLKKLEHRPDVILAKFYGEGHLVYDYANSNKIPLIIDNGESKITGSYLKDIREVKKYSDSITAVISNSSKCKDEGIELGLTRSDKVIVIPNGIDPSKFYRASKFNMRRVLGFDQNDFIVAFTGWFCYRKGSRRVSEAIDSLQNPNIKSIFIGQETETGMAPTCDGIIYCGVVLNEQIYKYLSAADVFVLPTLAEGCCNAIIEAMACGLPIISSNRSFNDELLDDGYAIRINPEDVSEIAEKIEWMYNHNHECKMMGERAWLAAQTMTMEKRARRMVDYISSVI